MKLLVLAVVALSLRAQEVVFTQVVTGVSAPTDIQNAGDGSGRLFLVQQNGIIRMARNGALLPDVFLDIRTKTVGSNERGLLGLAFPPGFAQKRRFYVNYTSLAGHTIIAMYRLGANDLADPASETILLTIQQPFANHNGGQIRFGPDGYLYIGMGDGGSGGDPQGNGQRMDTLLGKMLRVDVETEPGRVLVPSGNPFIGTAGARPEIWASGLRNPWRFSFDRATGDLWIADVGQDQFEEVDFQPAASRGGENYGWAAMEGAHCYRPNCSQQGLVLPVAEYTHASGGCSITGGFAYRGRLVPELQGKYIYGDLCSGRIFQYSSPTASLLLQTSFAITTFGEDEDGELYVANANTGAVHRMAPARQLRMTNAASFEEGMVAGSLATAFVTGLLPPGTTSADRIPLPLSLNGASVTVNGVAAPILAVANVNGQEQVNLQVPFETRCCDAATVVVSRAGQSLTNSAARTIVSQPAIYTSDGTRAVAVHNTGYTLVTAEQPLVRGEYAFVYAAGLRAPSNAPPTGAGAPSNPLALSSAEVLLAGQLCDVQFAGLAPGLVGVYQVNFRVRGDAPSGLQELRLRADGVTSRTTMVPVR